MGRYRTRHLAARDEQDEEDYQKEPKDVVVLVEPDREPLRTPDEEAPKGSTPPTRTAKAGGMYHACGGMLRGMRFASSGMPAG